MFFLLQKWPKQAKWSSLPHQLYRDHELFPFIKTIGSVSDKKEPRSLTWLFYLNDCQKISADFGADSIMNIQV